MCWAKSVFKPSFNTFPFFSYREVLPLWPSRGRLKCTSNSSSTWGKPTARFSTSPSRRRPEEAPQSRGRTAGRTTHIYRRGEGREDVNRCDSEQEVPLKQTWDQYHPLLLTPLTTPGVIHVADIHAKDPPTTANFVFKLSTLTQGGDGYQIADTGWSTFAVSVQLHTPTPQHHICPKKCVTVVWMCFYNHITNTFCKLPVF